MRASKRHRRQGTGRFGILLAAVLFCAVLVVVAVATVQLSSQAGAEGLAATRSAIERASVLCYATEGFYPPGIDYLEKNYGVQIDHNRYTVNYEVFSPSITPAITVVPKN